MQYTGNMRNFEVWPGPMEGVGRGGFIAAVNRLDLVPQWMTPFFRVSQDIPRNAKMREFLEPFKANPVPVCVQLMGTDPVLIGKCAAIFAGMDIASINLNFGCPSSRVISSGAGGGALRAPRNLPDFCRIVKSFLPEGVPLSVKVRAGWNDPEEMDEIIPLLAASPEVSKIFFHCRTVRELYAGLPAEERLRRFARAVELAGCVPVIINGDIASVAEGKAAVEKSGASGVMIARPWMRDPWLLRRFDDCNVPDAETGRERFFAEAVNQQLPPGALIELALMLWGRDSIHFRKLIADKKTE